MSNLVGHTYTSTDNEQSHIVFSLRAILHDYSTLSRETVKTKSYLKFSMQCS